VVALESTALSLAKTIVQKAAGAWIADRRTAEERKKELTARRPYGGFYSRKAQRHLPGRWWSATVLDPAAMTMANPIGRHLMRSNGSGARRAARGRQRAAAAPSRRRQRAAVGQLYRGRLILDQLRSHDARSPGSCQLRVPRRAAAAR
jgi:hypothetical protein